MDGVDVLDLPELFARILSTDSDLVDEWKERFLRHLMDYSRCIVSNIKKHILDDLFSVDCKSLRCGALLKRRNWSIKGPTRSACRCK
jgi:hypothetical protein